jgi:hypothetical protein
MDGNPPARSRVTPLPPPDIPGLHPPGPAVGIGDNSRFAPFADFASDADYNGEPEPVNEIRLNRVVVTS